MECCKNKNVNNENICINCGIIHGYKYGINFIYPHTSTSSYNI